MSKDREALKAAQRELRRKLREAKRNYKERIEARMEQNNSKEVWSGMKLMTGSKKSAISVEGDPGFAAELNLFFNRFDTPPTSVSSDSGSWTPPTIPVPVHTSIDNSAPLPTIPVPIHTSVDNSAPLLTKNLATATRPSPPLSFTEVARDTINPSPPPCLAFTNNQVKRELTKLKIQQSQWAGQHQPPCPQSVFWAACRSASTPLQSLLEADDGAQPVEDLLHCSSSKERTTQRPQ